MKRLVFDIETDDLNATKVWCIVAIDEDDKVYSFHGDTIEDGLKLLNETEMLIGHNILGFDIPVLTKLYDWTPKASIKIIDTLVLSRLFNPTREGGHSLERWGIKLGLHKLESPDFSEFSDEMLKYCIADTKLNKLLFENLRTQASGFSKECIAIEHDTTKILEEQKRNGFLFDVKKATLLTAKFQKLLKEVEEEVHVTFKPKWIDDKLVTPKWNKDGSLSRRGLTEEEYNSIIDGSRPKKPFMRKKLQEFNLGSRKQIGEYLQDFGWKPKKFTPTGQPIVDETTLKEIDHIYEAKLIADYLLYQKRIAQVQSWLDSVHDDDRVRGSVFCTGTITGRMAHRDPNMAQVPSVANRFGDECRACWIVPEGYKLVGVDASSLELRMLAHYMNDEEYTNEILHGDIHTANQLAAGLQSRNQAKTFIYAFLYGAGDEKIGSIVGGTKADGRKLKADFLANTPALKTLRARIEGAARRGYIKAIDKRPIKVRSAHAALNFLLQSAGAIIAKRAWIIFHQRCKLPFRQLGVIHDEIQVECRPEDAEEIGQCIVDSMRATTNYYNLRCPIDGEYKIGRDWNETH